MTRRAVHQRDIGRALKALESQGLAVAGVEISPDGAVRILTGDGRSAPVTELERWRTEHKDAGRAA